MGTSDTIIHLGTWQPATGRGAGRGRDIAPVMDGTTVIGHLVRYGDRDYRGTVTTPGPAGCYSVHNPTAHPVSGACGCRPADHAEAHRFSSDLAALIAVVRHHHQI